jgi:hypothetical protein
MQRIGSALAAPNPADAAWARVGVVSATADDISALTVDSTGAGST